jgi:hypothetical protein
VSRSLGNPNITQEGRMSKLTRKPKRNRVPIDECGPIIIRGMRMLAYKMTLESMLEKEEFRDLWERATRR